MTLPFNEPPQQPNSICLRKLTKHTLLILHLIQLSLPPAATHHLAHLATRRLLSPSRRSACVNVGGVKEPIGKYRAERSFLTFEYGPQPRIFSSPSTRIRGTGDPLAFVKSRYSAYGMQFSFLVHDATYLHTVTLGFAEVQSCKRPGHEIDVTVQDRYIGRVQPRKKGCRTAVYVTAVDVVPAGCKPKIRVVLTSRTTVSLSTLCVTRTDVPNGCTAGSVDDDCYHTTGNIGVAHMYGSLYSGTRSKCTYSETVRAALSIPSDARVEKAIIRWRGRGAVPEEHRSITVNGEVVRADEHRETGHAYSAAADVTDLVSFYRSGGYAVGNMYHRRDECKFVYAAWKMTVVFERDSLPRSSVTSCRMGPIGRFHPLYRDAQRIPCVFEAAETQVVLASTWTGLVPQTVAVNGEEVAKKNVVQVMIGPLVDITSISLRAYKGDGSSSMSVSSDRDNFAFDGTVFQTL